MTWVAVAIGGAALIGGAASYAGAQKQASAAKNAANLQMQQAQTNSAVQQPFVQSGYGALGKLNTLMGINPSPGSLMQPHTMQPNQLPPPQMAQPGMMTPAQMASRPQSMNQSPQLRQLLAIRANNGDAQAKQLLGMLQ
jgi:hypothetical protein